MENVGNSIFPCLYEKLLAKLYGNYESISQDPIDLFEIHTFYSREVIPFYIFKDQEEELVRTLKGCQEQGDMVFFRTRNSVGLQTLGLESNQSFTITRCFPVKDKILCEFLEIDGENWIGKYSKVRAFWAINHPEI